MKKTIIIIMALALAFMFSTGFFFGPKNMLGVGGSRRSGNYLLIDGAGNYLLIDGSANKLKIDGAS